MHLEVEIGLVCLPLSEANIDYSNINSKLLTFDLEPGFQNTMLRGEIEMLSPAPYKTN